MNFHLLLSGIDLNEKQQLIFFENCKVITIDCYQQLEQLRQLNTMLDVKLNESTLKLEQLYKDLSEQSRLTERYKAQNYQLEQQVNMFATQIQHILPQLQNQYSNQFDKLRDHYQQQFKQYQESFQQQILDIQSAVGTTMENENIQMDELMIKYEVLLKKYCELQLKTQSVCKNMCQMFK